MVVEPFMSLQPAHTAQHTTTTTLCSLETLLIYMESDKTRLQ